MNVEKKQEQDALGISKSEVKKNGRMTLIEMRKKLFGFFLLIMRFFKQAYKDIKTLITIS